MYIIYNIYSKIHMKICKQIVKTTYIYIYIYIVVYGEGNGEIFIYYNYMVNTAYIKMV